MTELLLTFSVSFIYLELFKNLFPAILQSPESRLYSKNRLTVLDYSPDRSFWRFCFPCRKIDNLVKPTKSCKTSFFS